MRRAGILHRWRETDACRGDDGKIDAGDLTAKIAEAFDHGIDGAQPRALSLTQITERGTAYSLEQIATLTAIARDAGLSLSSRRRAFRQCLRRAGMHPGRDDVEGRD
jgi:threonine aldolase